MTSEGPDAASIPQSAGPLRIAMCSNYLPSESKIGAGYQAHGLANAMVRAGHHVTMFSPCSRPSDALYEHRLVRVRKPLATFRWAWELRKQDFSGFDVLHAAMDDYLLLGKRRPPQVRTMHGSCFAEAVHIRGLKERTRMFVLGLTEVLATFVADRTVLVSDRTRKWYPWVKTVIPNGLDPGLFHPGGPKEDEPTILFVGTYRNRKRGQLLMEEFGRHIRPEIPNAKLWMVCSDAPSASGVEVLGRLTDEELAERYRRAWVFCLPSTYEGFGVPYIEALASGLPVVATPNDGATEVLDGGRYGIIAPDAMLGSELVRTLRDDGLRHRLSQRGERRAGEFYWPQIVERYEAVYADLLGMRAGGEPYPRGATHGTRVSRGRKRNAHRSNLAQTVTPAGEAQDPRRFT